MKEFYWFQERIGLYIYVCILKFIDTQLAYFIVYKFYIKKKGTVNSKY